MKKKVLEQLYKGLIVSCQALETEPLYGSEYMEKMAISAKIGGAKGIRANGVEDIKKIKRSLNLPVIGIIKKSYKPYDIYITPTFNEVSEVVKAGAEIVAIDCTERERPDHLTVTEFIYQIKKSYPNILIMADVSTFNEGINAAESGVDIIGTTLSGYTNYSADIEGPDFLLLEKLVKNLKNPIFAEGRVKCPKQASFCLELGAWSVVVGSAITKPQWITKSFVQAMEGN